MHSLDKVCDETRQHPHKRSLPAGRSTPVASVPRRNQS
jgi:hypothetical protein